MEPFNTLYFYYLLVIMVSVLSVTTYRPTAVEEKIDSEPKCTCPPDIAEEVKAAIGSFVPLYQYLGSGHGANHFYTTSPDEVGTTIPGQIGKHGFKSEGIAAHIYAAPAVVPLYRYYNGGIQDSLYTANFNELRCEAAGWKYEGIQGYCFKNSLPGINRPLYRYWSDNANDHFYTTNESEIGTTTIGVTGNHGYRFEDIVCYVV